MGSSYRSVYSRKPKGDGSTITTTIRKYSYSGAPSTRVVVSAPRTMRVDPYWLLREDSDVRDRAMRENEQVVDDLPADEVYLEKLDRILSASPCIGVPPRPSPIAPAVYIGTQANAENLECLKSMKINYILNCAGLPASLRHSRERRYAGSGIIYEELPIDDDEGFPIKNFFSAAHTFMGRARMAGGRVLVHCTGASRCGAIVISYLVRSGHRLMEAAGEVKKARRCALSNTSFMKQLIEHAREHGMLEPELRDVRAPIYGRKIDKHRIWSAHLGLVL